MKKTDEISVAQSSQNAKTRKQAEDALRKIEELYATLVDTIPEVVIYTDVDGKVTFVNDYGLHVSGYSREEVEGQNMLKFISSEYHSKAIQNTLLMMDGNNVGPQEYELLMKDGKKVPCEVHGNILRNENGTPFGFIRVCRDITERKQLEGLLIDSEEQYRRIFETASDGIVLLEKHEGKITQANPATEKLLGYTEKEIIGNKLQNIGVEFDTSDFQTTVQNLNKIGIIYYRNVKVETKSGQHIDTEIYLVDRAKLVQCNIRDITRIKALKERELRIKTILEV